MSDAYFENLRPYGVVVAVDHDATLETISTNTRLFEADLLNSRSDRELIETIARSFKCPEPYGRNWDALHEMLRVLDWFQWESIVFRVKNAKELLLLPPPMAVGLLKILSNCSFYWKSQSKTFLTTMEGDKKLYGLVYDVLSDWHVKSVP